MIVSTPDYGTRIHLFSSLGNDARRCIPADNTHGKAVKRQARSVTYLSRVGIGGAGRLEGKSR